MLKDWLVAFGLTLATELPLLLRLLRGAGSRRRILGVGLAANALTHPVVWFVLPRFFQSFGPYVFVAETWAAGAEALVYWLAFRKEGLARAVAASALANAASLGLGLALGELGWL